MPSPTTRLPFHGRPAKAAGLRDDTRNVHSTAAHTSESADSGWSDANDPPHRNAEYGSRSDHLMVEPYEPETGSLKMKQGSWAQVVGKGAQKGKMKETKKPFGAAS